MECHLYHTNECVNDPKVKMMLILLVCALELLLAAVELLLETLLMVECLEMLLDWISVRTRDCVTCQVETAAAVAVVVVVVDVRTENSC